jgi:hypothetical protein
MSHLLTVCAVALTLVGLVFRSRWPKWATTSWAASVFVAAVLLVLYVLDLTRAAVAHPPLWDFTCFWIYGTAAVHFHEVFSGAALRAAAMLPNIASIIPKFAIPQYTQEVLNPGMLYPPPTILLFYPLGFIKDAHHAALAWWLINLAALCAFVLVVWRTYFRVYTGLVATIVLVIGFAPTLEALRLGQTTIIMALFTALFFCEGVNRLRSGVWLALAIIAKPLVLLLLLYPIVKREYRTLAGVGAALIATTLAAIPLIGVGAIASYITNNPVSRVPGELYRYPGYQSLFSVLLRLSSDTASHYRFFDQYTFVGTAAVLVAVSVWLCWKLPDTERAVSLSLLSALALIVYPGTLFFYGILLLLPMCTLWSRRDQAPLAGWLVAAWWIIEAALLAVATKYHSDPALATCAFLAFVGAWLLLAVIACARLMSQSAKVARYEADS